MATSRPLAEIGSTERRRNSPSYNQATRKLIVTRDTSPYTENSFAKESPRSFWSSRENMSNTSLDVENNPDRAHSPNLLSPKRRASIEKLKQASRVKTSTMFALEQKDAYDPANVPVVERPAASRPLSQQLAGNSFARYDSLRKENNPFRSPRKDKPQSQDEPETQTNVSTPSKVFAAATFVKESSPSPTKSSLSKISQFGSPYDPESPWSEEDRAATPRGLNRHPKSVTFHADPPLINEYEEQTPEPSLSLISDDVDRSYDSEEYDEGDPSLDYTNSSGARTDDSFDEDLENADKTPVVLPEDWSRMSPDDARTDLVDADDDVFEGSPNPASPHMHRSPSVLSDGSARPLPPLPGLQKLRRASGSIAAAASVERASSALLNLPTAATLLSSYTTNDDANSRQTSTHSVVDRSTSATRDAMQANNLPPSLYAPARVASDRASPAPSHVASQHDHQDEPSFMENSEIFQNTPPRISRESILRRIRNSKHECEDEGNSDNEEQSELNHSSRPSYAELARMHPDEPVPSRETEDDYPADTKPNDFIDVSEVEIKQEYDDEDEINMSEIPDAEQSVLIQHDHQRWNPDEETSESASPASSPEPEAESTVLQIQREVTIEAHDGKETLRDAMQLLTVKDYAEHQPPPTSNEEFVGLTSTLEPEEDYDFGMSEYLAPSSAEVDENAESTDPVKSLPPLDTKPAIRDLPRPAYDGAEFSPPPTPESVMRQEDSFVSDLDETDVLAEPVPRDSPAVPERRATIRTGGKLKTRPSATPADLRMMAEQRRLVSAEHVVPPIPQGFEAEFEQTTEQDIDYEEDDDEENHDSVASDGNDSKADSGIGQHSESSTVDPSKLQLDIPCLTPDAQEDVLNLDREFDRVIEAQKKGYVTRQNTKVVVASNRNFSNESKATDDVDSAGIADGQQRSHKSPRKPSAEQFLQTEPWNGSTRRRSQRKASAQATWRSDAAPPLPGQHTALGVVEEDFAAGTSSLQDDVAEDVERGRLFVKVVGVKDLDLPLPRNDRVYFQLTLDNGLHCVTTSNIELSKSARIGQEFELVVLNDLEFQLTLNTKLPPAPVQRASQMSSPVKAVKPQKPTGTFSRFLSSPKKRAERERQEREAAEAEERRVEEEAQRQRALVQPSPWDRMRELVNSSDGSFARAYINLKAHEKQCFGQQLTVSVPCYNEWALEKDATVVNSVRSKRGNVGPIRRPPYVIGALELQLLYVPRPKDADDDSMPKSMSSALREITKAREVKEVVHEGHLSQQGGDCVHWRRRFFRLQGPRLTAYHERTQQKRAVINLTKASRLVDDKSSLVADPASSSPSKSSRRKSAFAEEDEGYQYVEEGFRIRFANGETIDFYADSRAQKQLWMAALAQVIGKAEGKKSAKWTDLVLACESGALTQTKIQASDVRDFAPAPAPPSSSSPVKPLPFSPKPDRMAPLPPHPAVRDPESSSLANQHPHFMTPLNRPSTPPMAKRAGHRDRSAVKSMIF